MFANGGGDLWPLMTVVGVVILGAVIAYSMIRNRKEMTRSKAELSERSTHQLYEAEQRDQARGS